MKHTIFVVAVVTFLSGCTASKPAIPFENYNRIASMEVTANKCVALGYIDYQTAASGKNLAARALNSWTYDPAVYQTVFLNVSGGAEVQPPNKAQCEEFAVYIIQKQQQDQQAYQQQQLQIQQQQQLNQSLQNIQNTMPKTTYCNRIGWQTVCNTY